MSQDVAVLDITFKAAEDLTDYQYHFVKLDADGKVEHCTASTDVIIGILMNAPDAEDKAARVRVLGTGKLVMQGTCDEGALITAEDQAAAYGEGLATTTAKDFIGGIALEASLAADQIIEVLIVHFILWNS